MGMLQVIILNEMEDADVVVDNAHTKPKTTLSMEASLIPGAVLPRL
jgi:hypothetical protein